MDTAVSFQQEYMAFMDQRTQFVMVGHFVASTILLLVKGHQPEQWLHAVRPVPRMETNAYISGTHVKLNINTWTLSIIVDV